jgi:hypothetical protein
MYSVTGSPFVVVGRRIVASRDDIDSTQHENARLQ